jgi:hypothetical protein
VRGTKFQAKGANLFRHGAILLLQPVKPSQDRGVAGRVLRAQEGRRQNEHHGENQSPLCASKFAEL